jgi:hypothetical protein
MYVLTFVVALAAVSVPGPNPSYTIPRFVGSRRTCGVVSQVI